MPSSCHAWLPPSTLPSPLLSSPSSPSHTCCMPKCMPSTSPGAWQHNIIHIMNSSGGAHEMRRFGGIHLCHQCHVPLPTKTPSPFTPAHPSHHACHADQPALHPIPTSPKSTMWTLSANMSASASSPCTWLTAPHPNPPLTRRPSLQNSLCQNWAGCTCHLRTSVHCRRRWGRTMSGFVPIFVRPDHPHRPVHPAGPTRPTRPYRPLSHSLSRTLVCFYYPSLLGTLNSP